MVKKMEVKEPQRDEIAIAGLERAHVDQFESLGFERSKVVRLRKAIFYIHDTADGANPDRRSSEIELPWRECRQYFGR